MYINRKTKLGKRIHAIATLVKAIKNNGVKITYWEHILLAEELSIISTQVESGKEGIRMASESHYKFAAKLADKMRERGECP